MSARKKKTDNLSNKTCEKCGGRARDKVSVLAYTGRLVLKRVQVLCSKCSASYHRVSSEAEFVDEELPEGVVCHVENIKRI